MKSIITCLVIAMLTSISTAVELKALVITGGHAFEKEHFFKVFEEIPGLSLSKAEHDKASAMAYDLDDLLSFDVVVLYDMPMNITAAQKAKFLSLFDEGIGVVVLHHALVSYQDWPEYEQIIGGRYPKPPNGQPQVTDKVGYQHDCEVPVTIVTADHPITTGLKPFTIHDEIYWGFRVSDDVTPLLSTTHEKSGKPLCWTRQQGKSRLVYLQLGHDHQAYENPNYRELVARSIKWVAAKGH